MNEPPAAKKTSKNLIGLVACAALVFGAPLIGQLVTALFLRGAFEGTASVDPSEKARFLAEGISDSMNAVAIGVVIAILAMVPTCWFALRLYRENQSGPSKPE